MALFKRKQATPPIPQPQMAGDPWALHQLLYGGDPTVRLPVTERTLLGLPAAWSAVAKISNAAAQMLRSADVYLDGDQVEVPQVVRRPNYGYGPFSFYKEIVSTALVRGNWVALLTAFDAAGYPTALAPLPVDAVNCYVDTAGYVVYEIAGVQYSPDEVAHVRLGVTQPGNPWCIGVIEAHRRGISGQLDQQGMAIDVFRTGAVPSGVVTLDADMPTSDQVTAVKESWVGALDGKRTVAVVGKRMTYQPVDWSAEDAQFIEARQFSVAEMALIFGLRPEDLGATIGGSNTTYGNRTDDALQRITDAYMPVVVPIEEAFDDLLPEGMTIKANAEALLRSSTKERYEIHEIAQRIGLQTANETREIEGRAPLDDDTTTEEVTDEPAA